MNKSELRECVKTSRKGIAQDWWAKASESVLQRLLHEPVFVKADVVACYLDVRGEVGTRGILDACWRSGKKVCVPAHDDAVDGYSMAVINEGTELIEGCMGIEEPADPEWVDCNAIDLFLVPGLAFDPRGGRVGYGGGYYDSLMKGTGGTKAALAFDLQVFDEVPVAAHDVLLNMILTETRVLSVVRPL